jgi:long-chain acyl-CoA synthetase
MDEAIKTRGE